MASLPLLGLALLAWTLTLLAMGAALGVLARSFGDLAGFAVAFGLAAALRMRRGWGRSARM